ncbi:MAG: diguanylate cyclase [Candidatus Tenebribacter mawsonii]|nr:diguanylate cyclase [Candidatus Tenebribacter mawsonii]
MNKLIGLLIVLTLINVSIFAEDPVDETINFLPEENKAEYFFDRGLGYYNLNQYSKALTFLNQALEIYTQSNDKPKMTRCYNNIGNIYNKLNIFNKAMEYHLQSLELGETLNDNEGIVSSLNNIGNVLRNIEKYDEALDYYQRALDLSYEINDNKSLAITLNNIGNIYLSKENYKNALSFYNRSLILKKELKDNFGIATSYNNIGISYQGLGSTAKALENHSISLDMMKKLKDGDGIASAYFHIGIIYYEKNENKKASFNLEKALVYAQNYDNKQIMIPCYKILGEIYSKQRDYFKAFIAMKLYAQIKDDMVSVQTQKAVAELQIRHETEKKEKEIELLKTKASIIDYQSKESEMFMIILVVVFIAVTVMGFFFYFQFRQKANSNKAIEEQNLMLTQAYSKMEELAKTDMLTGLSNRRDMYQKIKHETDRFERNENSFVILMADIDNFKKINDTYGHDAGDHVLTSISSLMLSFMRKQDIVGRWGGEEFLLLLPETNLEGGKKIAEKLKSRIKNETIQFKGHDLKVTITIGLSLYDRICDVNESIKEADKAMYFGKIRNKNCVVTANDI